MPGGAATVRHAVRRPGVLPTSTTPGRRRSTCWPRSGPAARTPTSPCPGLLNDRGLSGRDAALATELAYGTCRALGQLDAVIGACCDRPLAELDGPVLDALRLAAYQLLHTRIPDHAAVSVTVDLVRAGPHPGAAGFVNAVLRRMSRNDLAGWIAEIGPDRDADPLGYLALSTAHPRWIVTAIQDALGATG